MTSRPPGARAWIALIGGAMALALATGAVLVSTGFATTARSTLFPTPTPTVTPPPWLVPASSAPSLSGAAPLATAAPAPDAGALAAALGPRLTLGSGRLGAAVLDGATGQLLFGQEPAAGRVPASNLKLLTAAAALTSLGPEARLSTRAVRGTEPGTVVLVGGGDVMLAPGASAPEAVMGRAGLGTLAAQTAEALAGTRGEIRVLLDDTLFTGPALNPSWALEDVKAGEMAPLFPVAMHGGRSAVGVPGPRPEDSALDAAKAFRASLAEALAGSGATVAAEVSRGRAPGVPVALAAVESATVAEQVGYMLRESDNYAAEALARLASRAAGGTASNDGAIQALEDAAADVLGAEAAAGVTIADACGLALGNRLSPAALAGIVRAMAAGDPALRPGLDGLPVAHLDGTLAQRFGEGPAAAGAGVVRAKTGTLNTVAALTGYTVDADGRLLVFSFVADGVDPAARQSAVRAIDSAVGVLAACGCRG